jgi:hypothetical protein
MSIREQSIGILRRDWGVRGEDCWQDVPRLWGLPVARARRFLKEVKEIVTNVTLCIARTEPQVHNLSRKIDLGPVRQNAPNQRLSY